MKGKELDINDFDLSKPKNRRRISKERKKCEIELKEFPNSSNIDKLIATCYRIINDNSDDVAYDILRTLRSLRLLDEENQPTESLRRLTKNENELIAKNEFASVIARSPWMCEWLEWAGKNSVFDLKGEKAKEFLQSVSYGRQSTINSVSYVMNSLLGFCLSNHPSRDTQEFPDTMPPNKLIRKSFDGQSIMESGEAINAVKRVSKGSEFVRIATGYLSILGYDIVARNLDGAQVRLLVGSNDRRGRMEIANAVNDLKGDIESGPSNPMKIQAARKLRQELVGGGIRVRCLKARHTPDFHTKVQIYDRSAVLSGSFNLSYNGLVKNVENCEVVVEREKVDYYIHSFDNFFHEAIPIEDDLIDMLDQTWALSSDEILDPSIVYLRALLEYYGVHPNDENFEGVGLDEYQEYSVNKSIRDLQEFGGSLLVSPTGTGKTMMGSVVASRLVRTKKVSRIFVIAPNQQILEKWEYTCMQLAIPFQGFTYSNFNNPSERSVKRLESLKISLNPDDLIIADECHKIRNIGSGSEKILDIIGAPSTTSCLRLFLTATPMSKELEEMNNLLKFTHGTARVNKERDVSRAPSITYLTHNLISQKFAKESSSGHRYVSFSGEDRYFAIKKTEQVKYNSPKLDLILEKLRVLDLSYRKSLPEGQQTLDGSTGESRGGSDELRRVYLSRTIESSPARGISAIERIMEDDLESEYYKGELLREDLQYMKNKLNESLNDDQKLKSLIDYMRMFVERGDGILIFAEYKHTIEYLKEKLQKAFPVPIESLTSEDSPSRRKDVCERFSAAYHGLRTRNGDPKILIATDALSEGVDLPDAKLMVNYDLFWTPLKMVQRVGRLDRPTEKKRTFTAVNMVPSSDTYNSLFRLQSRLDKRSGAYRKMAGIEVYRENIRDLDNPNEDDLRAARSMHGEYADEAYEEYTEQFATEVLSQLAKASDEERKQAMDLPLGATSCIQSVGSDYKGILSVVRDPDGIPHVISEHYEDFWGGKKKNPNNPEERFQNAHPKGRTGAKIPDSFFVKHEKMLAEIAEKYSCDTEELIPVVNLIKS